jgi:hydroxycarboxylate dehydrogenase B
MRITADNLHALVVRIFEAAGVQSDIARRTADHLVDANLAGVDSHGVLRVPDYVALVKQGRMAREDKIEVICDLGAACVMDAHYTFGQYAAWRASELAMQKADQFGIGMVTCRNSSHVGRIGEYVEHMATRGYIGYMCANLQGSGQRVAPYGGKEARLSTNPLAYGIPTGGVPMVIDMSTSVSAEGKIRVKMRRGESLTPGWLLDRHGNETLNPADLYGPPYGAILTTGGHKGYGLSLVVEALAGILPDGGFSRPMGDVESLENGFALMALRVDLFRPLAGFTADMDTMLAHMKNTPPRDGVAEVLTPNEPETRERAKRREHGIEIEADTWALIEATANELGVGV